MRSFALVIGVLWLSATAQGSCIEPIHDYDRAGAPVNPDGWVQGFTASGETAFYARATWETDSRNSLVYREPVNTVTIDFLDPAGAWATSVEMAGFRLVMDMGGHAHTTDECPETAPQILPAAPEVTIQNINFVMASRQANKWFFHNFTATVNGVVGTVSRYNVPHPVR